MRQGDRNRAEEEFRRDISIEPEVPDTYELLGEYFLRAGNNEQAEHFFREALRRNTGMAEAQIGLTKIYLAQRKFKEALAEIDSALRLGSDVQSAHYLRGRILTKLGRREEAQKEMIIASRMADAGGPRGQDALDENRVPHPELAQPPQ
jgi:Tfp pilus assembly protein PilF